MVKGGEFFFSDKRWLKNAITEMRFWVKAALDESICNDWF